MKSQVRIKIERPITANDQMAPEQVLAMSVIHQAIKDCEGTGILSTGGGNIRGVSLKRIKDEARYFIFNDEGFVAWCVAAGLSASYLRNKLKRRLRR